MHNVTEDFRGGGIFCTFITYLLEVISKSMHEHNYFSEFTFFRLHILTTSKFLLEMCYTIVT